MDLGQALSSRDSVINFQTVVSNPNFMSHNKNPYIGSGGLRLNSNTNSLLAFNDPSGILRHGDVLMPNISH